MKTTLVTLYRGEFDKANFETLFIPSLVRFFEIEKIDKFIVIYRTLKPVVANEFLRQKTSFIPYKNITSVRDMINTSTILYLSPNTFFFRPCFIKDLVVPEQGALTSRDENQIYYKQHLLNNYFPQNNNDYMDRLKTIKVASKLYRLNDCEYLSYNPTNPSGIV